MTNLGHRFGLQSSLYESSGQIAAAISNVVAFHECLVFSQMGKQTKKWQIFTLIDTNDHVFKKQKALSAADEFGLWVTRCTDLSPTNPYKYVYIYVRILYVYIYIHPISCIHYGNIHFFIYIYIKIYIYIYIYVRSTVQYAVPYGR